MASDNLSLRRWLGTGSLRGNSWVTVLTCAVLVVLLASTIAMVYQNTRFAREVQEKAGIESARGLGGILASSAEALMAAGELSTLRGLIGQEAIRHRLESCRVVLPSGEVLADAEPSRITLLTLPQSWAGPDREFSQTYEGGRTVAFAFPLRVPGRGTATLEMVAPVHSPSSGIEPQASQMAIACLALATLLLVHRQARSRFQAIGAIQEALMAVREGQPDVRALELDPRLGPEAQVWNRLLGDRQGQQAQKALEQVSKSIHEKSHSGSDLIAACEVLSGGVLLVGENRRIEYANGAAAALLQIPVPQLVHAPVENIPHPAVVEAIGAALERSRAGRTVDVEVQTPAGTAVLRFTLRPFQVEDRRQAVVTIEDITQSRVAEAARNSFLAQATHELRTPLTSIQLYAENALDQGEGVSKTIAESLNVINEEARRLEQIVAQVLSISEIEAGSLRLRRDDVHLDALFAQLQAEHSGPAQDKQIRLTFDLPPKLPVIKADRDKLAMAVHNLLGNALKYTPAGGTVTVQVTLEAGTLYVEVTDTGIGIAPEDQALIFEKFCRARDRRVAEITGSGLGLAIARDIIRMHGGDIQVRSKLDLGSTFTLTLPIAEEAADHESGSPTGRCSAGD
ncbi:MAG: PAS domain-containing protein [Phycisphaerae bacterium]|nr:PAS domain-containing protein [Phycisphaerae bacterium]